MHERIPNAEKAGGARSYQKERERPEMILSPRCSNPASVPSCGQQSAWKCSGHEVSCTGKEQADRCRPAPAGNQRMVCEKGSGSRCGFIGEERERLAHPANSSPGHGTKRG